jgi:eukaryotic-like serine/threonine-protein kinase
MIRRFGHALSRAHEHGIIHRDLKPENIFLVRGPDDDEDVAKVLDFGIAKIKAAPGAVGVSSSTKTGTLLGTPFYMSPEQCRGLRSVDHRSDLWSLGVIVFKCVTGVLPFDGESLGDLLVKICTVPVPLPSHVVPGLPAELDAWMIRALDREPDRRFQTAGELADSLATLAGVSVRRDLETSGNSTPQPVSPAAPPNSLRAASGTLPAPGAPSPLPSAIDPMAAATSAPFTASSPRSRGSSRIGIFGAAAFGLLLGVGLILFKYGAGKSGSSDSVAAAARIDPLLATSSSVLLPPSLPSPTLSPSSPQAPLPPPPLLTAGVAETPAAIPGSSASHPPKPPTRLLPWKPLPKASPTPTPLPAVPATPPKATPSMGEPGY